MIRRTLLALTLCAASASYVHAQDTQAQPAAAEAPLRKQVLSLQPIHVMLEWYSGEYERALNSTTTLGVGGSFFGMGDVDYFSADAKLRYYPSGDALRGLSFGFTLGPTVLSQADIDNLDEEETFQAIGIGFELAKSQLLGQERRFYYGYGAGIKRLIPFGDDSDAELSVPTLRFAIGYAF